ncbi:MAG: hypothetical protein B1H11_10270 [Desulfobacteraceae bacterium 4484_190.1]|nr:MAG: hypothetical protein B1H11_10270 [Desulfobacteraceae bacterium 4484_190.1]
MFSKKTKLVILPAFVLFLLFISSVLLLNELIHKPSVQRYLLEQLSRAVNFEFHTRKMEITFWGGIGITLHDIEARSLVGPERTLSAPKARITFDVSELIQKRFIPKKIYLLRPRMEFAFNKDQQRPLLTESKAQLFKEIVLSVLSGQGMVTIEMGRIYLKDLPLEVNHFYMNVSQKIGAFRTLKISSRGTVLFKKEEAGFRLHGTINQDAVTLAEPILDITIDTDNTPLTWFPYPSFLPVKKGHASCNLNLKGPLSGPISAEGKIDLHDISFLMALSDRIKEFSFPQFMINFESTFSKKTFEFPYLRVQGPDFSLSSSLKLDFKDSSNPYIGLEVKSDYMSLSTLKSIIPFPIIPRWIKSDLLPILSGGFVRLDLFSLKGTFEEFKNMDLPENEGAVLMKLHWKEVEVFKDKSSLPFRKVAGEMTLAEGDLHITGVKFDFGDSILKCGSLDISNLFRSARSTEVSIDGFFKLEDLMKYRDNNLIPAGFRSYLQKFESASGNLDAKVIVRYEHGWDLPVFINTRARVSSCSVMYQGLYMPLTLDEADIEADKDGKWQLHGTGLWGKSRFDATVSAENDFAEGSADITGQADMNDILDYFGLINRQFIKFKKPVVCHFSLLRKKGRFSCRGKANLKGVSAETRSFSIEPPGDKDSILIDLVLDRQDRLYIRNIKYLTANSFLNISGSCNVKDFDLFNLDVFSPGIAMKELGILSRKDNTPAKGILSCDLKIDLSLKDPLKTNVTGEIEGKDFSFALSGISAPFRELNFKAESTRKKVSIDYMNMYVGKSSLSISGDFTGWDGLKGDLSINSPYLNISDFICKEMKSKPALENIDCTHFMKRSDVHLNLNVDKGIWKKIEYGPLTADFLFKSGDFYLNQSDVKMEHGNLFLKGHLKNGKEQEAFFFSHVKLIRQPAKELFESLDINEVFVEGNLSLDAILSGKGQKMENLLSGLTGSANIFIEKGTIHKSSIIFSILDYFSIRNIYTKRPKDLSKKGFYFENIGGQITIINGVASSENLIMRSPVFNAVARGNIDIPKNWTIDLYLGAQPLGTIDSLLSKIPVIGYILTGKEKSLVIYYFKVEGTLSDPKVKYVPLKHLGNMAGFFKRLFFAPGGLIGELYNISKGLIVNQ